jgi:ribosomal protein L2
MLQPRICRFQPARLGKALVSVRNYAAQGFMENSPKPVITPTATVDSAVIQTEGPRKDKFIPLRTYKPRTPGLRHLKRPVNDHLWKGRPYLKLTIERKGQHLGGRNNTGRVTVRHRGGGHKRRIRIIDYKRYLPGKHIVERIEYDPNRSSHLALLTRVATGEKSYIVAADGMRAGDEVESYRTGIPKELIASMGGQIDPGMLAAKTAARGNCLPIHMVPLGSQVFNVGSKTQGGGVFCRSAGTYAIIVNKEEVEKAKGTEIKSVIIRLQSGEIRKVSPDACCTIGVASNPQSHFTSLGKAGRSRWLGKRPEVRGLAMNAGQFSVLCYCATANVTQRTIPTVVVVVNQRVTSSPSVRGGLQPRVATRHDTRGTSTHSWFRTGHETRASAGRNKLQHCTTTCRINHVPYRVAMLALNIQYTYIRRLLSSGGVTISGFADAACQMQHVRRTCAAPWWKRRRGPACCSRVSI